jgi:hypothetical protein
MKIDFSWLKPKRYFKLEPVERRLEAVLQPVEPRPEFVRELRQKLVGPAQKGWLGLAMPKFEVILLVVGSIASVGIVLVAGIRALITLLGTIGVLQASKQVNKKAIKPAGPAFN